MVNFFFKYLFIFILIFQFISYSKIYSFNSSDIKNIPARDLFDVLTKLSSLHGLSYGRTGQVMQVKALGKDQYNSMIYIDDIPLTNFHSGLYNLSTFSLDRIDNIIIDDSPINNSSASIYIYTKKYEIAEPVTEMIYRDAFYNHRNISMHLGQRFKENISFLLFADITDYMDHRESSDDFTYPYKKQNYNLQVKLPGLFSLHPSVEFSYLKENIYDFSLDSLLYKPEMFRGIFNLNSISSDCCNNKLSFIYSFKQNYFDSENRNFTILDQFAYNDSINLFNIKTQVEFYEYLIHKGESVFSIEPSYERIFQYITTNLNSYLSYSDYTKLTYSGGLGIVGQVPLGFSISSKNSIYSGKYRVHDDIIDVEFFENELYLENIFTNFYIEGSISSGIDIIEYRKNSSDTFTWHLSRGVKRYSKSKLQLMFTKSLSLSLEYAHRISSKTSIYDPSSTIISSLNFTDSYFNENLQISTSVLHKYSDFNISESNKEIINDLGINLRARIVDVEIFFGIDNIMKNKYEINNDAYILNEHYGYQTIEGYDMQRFDEIWGVRWIFRY